MTCESNWNRKKIQRSRWSGDINGGIAACLFVLLFLIFRSCLLYSSLCKAQIAAPEVHRQQFIGAKNESWLCWLLVSKPFHLAAAATVTIRFTFTFTEYITIKSKERKVPGCRTWRRNWIHTHSTYAQWHGRERWKGSLCRFQFCWPFYRFTALIYESISSFPIIRDSIFSPFQDTISTAHGSGCVCCVRYNGENWIAANILIRYCRVLVCCANWWNSSKWIKCEWCCVCHTKLFCFSVDGRRRMVCPYVRAFILRGFSSDFRLVFAKLPSVNTQSDDKWYCLCAALRGHALFTCFSCTCTIQLLPMCVFAAWAA